MLDSKQNGKANLGLTENAARACPSTVSRREWFRTTVGAGMGIALGEFVDLLLGDAAFEQRGQDLVCDQQIVGLLVGEERIADEEVEEAGRVVGEVDPVRIPLLHERD